MDKRIEKAIKKYINVKDNHSFIIEKNLKRLRLTEDEENFVIDELQRNNISIKKDRSTRPQTVKDYTYGQIIESEDYQNDIPVMAKLNFDENGNLISEDWSKLDTFLAEQFIPTYITMKPMIDDTTKEKLYYPSIQLNFIVKLQCCELEVAHIMNYLKEKGIYVTGSATSLIGEFENYDYVSPTKNSEKKSEDIVISPKLTAEKLKKFKENNSMKLRNEIIVENMHLVQYIAQQIHQHTHIDAQELESFGYEGLIKAVDGFDIGRGNQFSTYAYTAIKYRILRGVLQIWGYKLNNTHNNISFARCMIEREMDTQLAENPEIVDDIIALLITKGDISSKNAQHYKRMLLLNVPQNLDEYLDKVDISSDNSDEYLTNDYNNSSLIDESSTYDEKYAYDIPIKEALDNLTPKEREIIKLHFGLNNNTPLSLQKCGKLFGVSGTTIKNIENKALVKLRHPKISKKLKDLI